MEERTCARVELFAFDFAALENVGGERLQDSFLLEVESERLHMADQAALPAADRGQRLGELFGAPVKPGPVLELVDIHSPHLLRRL